MYSLAACAFLWAHVALGLRLGEEQEQEEQEQGVPIGLHYAGALTTSYHPCLGPFGYTRELNDAVGKRVNVTFKCQAVSLKNGSTAYTDNFYRNHFYAVQPLGAPMEGKHIAQMAVLQRSASASSGTPQTTRELADKGYLTKSPIIVYALEKDGDLIGSILYKNPVQASDKETGEVLCRIGEAGGLAVQSNYRNYRVAQVMATILSTLAHGLGFTAIYTETKVANYKSLKTQVVPYKSAWTNFKNYGPRKVGRNLAATYAGMSTVVGYVQTKRDLPDFKTEQEVDDGPTVYKGTIFALLVSPAGVVGMTSLTRRLSKKVNDACESAAWEDMLSNPHYEKKTPFMQKDLEDQFRSSMYASYAYNIWVRFEGNAVLPLLRGLCSSGGFNVACGVQ
eukprot:TRINITY_DN6605_c0_g1_i1.p1 TRINITY_DN6605_c0_g1~~TRINITY_DN6605_c0_g1_i1.p1  ORF type:complete len:393 (+),score=49.55 TRINITY_DN6605_c0_g1_i1:105-1283(+)